MTMNSIQEKERQKRVSSVPVSIAVWSILFEPDLAWRGVRKKLQKDRTYLYEQRSIANVQSDQVLLRPFFAYVPITPHRTTISTRRRMKGIISAHEPAILQMPYLPGDNKKDGPNETDQKPG
jgi:hypothetical protein